jgi:hypothetical protein
VRSLPEVAVAAYALNLTATNGFTTTMKVVVSVKGMSQQLESENWLWPSPVGRILLPRKSFLSEILTKSVVFLCSRLLILCMKKGWQNARRAGNIVPRKPESEH